MKRVLIAGAVALGAVGFGLTAQAGEDVYAGFPVTVMNYQGTAETSVSYRGQTARHVLHDSLKKLAALGNGSPNANLRDRMLAYLEGTDDAREILAPATKGPFVVEQVTVGALSKGKNLAGKTFKGAVAGMPNNMTGPELVKFWIEKASAADKGFDAANGYDYPQLISKFIMGAVFYNQVVDTYLDENLEADKKPNDQPYAEGAAYTGKEHSWDEAFGYFGVPAHGLTLTPQAIIEIAKQGDASEAPESALAHADYNKDGQVDLGTEMTFAPAYYAANFDVASAGTADETRYVHTITRAFLEGRRLLAAANGEVLSDTQRAELKGYAAVIEQNWEKVLAEAAFKYAGSVYKDLTKLEAVLDAAGDPDKINRSYVKHWGEMKGFSLALQTGRKNLGEVSVRLNRLIGAGPVLVNASQVIDIDSKGNFVKDEALPIGEYMLHMLKVQDLLAAEFGLKARENDMLADLKSLADKFGSGASAEND